MRRASRLVGVAILVAGLTGCIPPEPVDTGISAEEAEFIFHIQEEGAAMVRELLAGADSDPMQAVVEWIREQPLIADAEVAPSGDIEILYECGVSGWILTSSVPVPTTSVNPSVSDNSLQRPTPVHVTAIRAESGNTKRALILLPHNAELTTPNQLPAFLDQLEQYGYSVDGPFIDEAASLEVFRTLANYELVYILTHGVAHVISSNRIALTTGSKTTASLLQQIVSLFDKEGIEVVTMVETGQDYVGVNNRFFDDLTYPGTLIIANACESLKHETLADTFLSAGAQCFVGWTQKSNTHFVNIATAALAQALSEGETSISAIWTASTDFGIGSWGSYAGVSGQHALQDLFPRCDLRGRCPDYIYRGDYDFASGDGVVTGERKIVYFSNHDDNAEIWMMDSDGSDGARLTTEPKSDWDPDWSPDGDTILFQSWRDDNAEIYLMDADGTDQRNITNNPAQEAHPDWSPDGSRIVFCSDRHDPGGDLDIYVMDSDGSNVARLAQSPGYDWYPAWSPDGSRIAFSSNRSGQYQVYVMDSDGTNAVQLTQGSDKHQPAWSPDGDSIVYIHTRSGSWDLYTMDVGGTSTQKLTGSSSEYHRDPSWAPGDRILFSSNLHGDYEIYSIRSDGSERIRLTDNDRDDFHPAWGPSP